VFVVVLPACFVISLLLFLRVGKGGVSFVFLLDKLSFIEGRCRLGAYSEAAAITGQ
jgi:hypothetical protein